MMPLDTDVDPCVVGPFELLARLGAGGMGVAYVARKIPLDGLSDELAAAYHMIEPDGVEADDSRLAVVKMIQPDLLEQVQARDRFSMEIDAVRAVVSERVPALLAADSEAAQPWFAMDYVAGPSLHTMIKEAGALAVGPCAALGLALVDALRAIHSTGLLHRDLKPGNVVLGPDGPVVLDFGLAVLIERRTSQAITRPGQAWGTWPYTSYEQLHDFMSAKEPTDVYALGATLFFALTGRPPYTEQPLLTPPNWNGVASPFLPLLGQILVEAPGRRPDLDGVETGLRAVLLEAGLTHELAAEELRALVIAADLTPKLPPGALADQADPAVRELAQKAVDEGAAPDAPWAEGAAVELPDDDLGFYGIVDTDEMERAADAADRADSPDVYTPTLVDPAPAQPVEPVPQPAPGDDAPPHQPEPDNGRRPTSYRLAPPHSPKEASSPTPKAPPRAAQNVAARLCRAYAHRGDL
ncbi:protein kinase [Streptomyces sp. Je 1-4]|uniref:serine/threonine protein kinase n=1 Tax=Streptomyces TaxID=1883 RepID=UPI0021D9C1D6|nr:MULTISPECIES: serine/threonine-protein kinase [unclassified Streptomyces]UYB39488.1 protein kinase [Streptomyces sp. Je 1-4]UZQ35522.1 protein kinase [Streptomyces sp. Je 1-4] [Streptomyces sp. Je 1-4 4N24]UZQ42940.1 protein kinase [Streptomyces sp. Je 1-4] [Streptomyces sp. Je 1-4 4N24_ara]